jgi:hypothetical protein
MNNRNYPECEKCGHQLCFMDRRDWDDCPACGTRIPLLYRLDIDYQPIDPSVPPGMIPMASGLVPISSPEDDMIPRWPNGGGFR